MKLLNKLALSLLVTLLAARSTLVRAQELKPVGVVAIASIKENLADVAYVTRAAGMPDYGDTARFLVGAMTAGIDKDRPIGFYFVPKDREFHAIGFVPLEKDGLQTILKVQKETLGEARDVGDGVLQIGRGREVFVKQQNGWAFLADEKSHLASLPQQPADIIGDLPTKYNIAGRLFVQNIPEDLRRTGIDEIKLGMERFLDSPAARQGNINREQARQLTTTYLAGIEKLINEADQVLLGLAIDEPTKKVRLDIGVAAKEGTSLAKSMALQTQVRTNFAGFALPEAAVTLTCVSQASPEDVKQAQAAIKTMQAQYSKVIDDAPGLPPEKREPMKALLAQVYDVLDKSIATGKIDGGACVVMLPNSLSFAAGGAVADGAAVERILKSLVDLSKDIPNFPQVKLNDGKLGDLNLNRLIAPLPAGKDEARQMFGDNLEIIVAVGPKSVIIAGGKDAEDLLKKIVDQSAQQGDKAVKPLEFIVSVLPILRFAKSMHDHPALGNVLTTLEQTGNDKVLIVTDAGQRTSISRIEIQEGVIRAIGEGAKAAGAGPRQAGR